MLSGIYKITCVSNKKIYIGSSCKLSHRWRQHLSALKLKTHYNKHLQSAYNKYGEESLLFSILEYVEENNLLIREQYYLDLLKSYDRNIGFNMCNKAENGKSDVFDSSKHYLVISPSGEEFIVSGLDKFSRTMGFSESGLRNVALGRAFQFNGGWHCRYAHESYEDWLSRNSRKSKSGAYSGSWQITYKNGDVKIVDSLHKFCVENNYSESNIFLMRQGKRKSHKGIVKVERTV